VHAMYAGWQVGISAESLDQVSIVDWPAVGHRLVALLHEHACSAGMTPTRALGYSGTREQLTACQELYKSSTTIYHLSAICAI
jgi:hypothetical protein